MWTISIWNIEMFLNDLNVKRNHNCDSIFLNYQPRFTIGSTNFERIKFWWLVAIYKHTYEQLYTYLSLHITEDWRTLSVTNMWSMIDILVPTHIRVMQFFQLPYHMSSYNQLLFPFFFHGIVLLFTYLSFVSSCVDFFSFP